MRARISTLLLFAFSIGSPFLVGAASAVGAAPTVTQPTDKSRGGPALRPSSRAQPQTRPTGQRVDQSIDNRRLRPSKLASKRRSLISAKALAPALFTSATQSYGPVGDFNGNGTSDVFAVTRDGKRLLWQISDGGRKPFVTINAHPAEPGSLRFADFDGNGRVDVFHLNRRGEWFVAADGRGRLQSLGKHGLRINELGFSDFDGDGKSDILQIDAKGYWRMLSAGRGKWQALGRFGGAAADVGLGDFDGDGQTEALRIDAKGTWQLLDLRSRQWTAVNRLGGRIADLHLADIDGNGRTDVASWQQGRWLFAPGARGKWQKLTSSPVSAAQSRVGDFDGDGRADLFFEQSKESERRWMYLKDFRSRPALLRTVVEVAGSETTSGGQSDTNGPAEDDIDPAEDNSDPVENNAGNPGSTSSGAATPVFQVGLRLTEAPGRCHLEPRHINACVLANGRSAAAIAAQINRLQANSIIGCCSALARVARTAGSSNCTLIEAPLQAQLGCRSP